MLAGSRGRAARNSIPEPDNHPGMVTFIEVAILLLALALLFGAYRTVRAVKPFVWNAVVGLVVLLAANWFGVPVDITWLSVLVCAIAGVPGALLVIILAYVGLAFGPAATLAFLPG